MGSAPHKPRGFRESEVWPTRGSPDAMLRRRRMVAGQAGTGVSYSGVTEWGDQWPWSHKTVILVLFLHLPGSNPSSAPYLVSC